VPHTVRIKRSAAKDLEAIDDADLRGRIADVIDLLATTPRPDSCVKVHGVENTWRVRVGSFRVLYEVDDRASTVLVVAVGNRKEVYR
jgi:mRNA interferase RelE/StbE